jgi:hypothetical protein
MKMDFLKALSFTMKANFKLGVVVEVGSMAENLLVVKCVLNTVLVASINSLKQEMIFQNVQ